MLLPQRLTKPQLAIALLFTLTLSLVLLLSTLAPGNAQTKLADLTQSLQTQGPDSQVALAPGGLARERVTGAAASQWYPHPLDTSATTIAQVSENNLTLANGFQPKLVVRPANPTNYGPRFTQDIDGNPINNPQIVVLHETVGSGSSAINTIQAPQVNESRQVSYHAIVLRDGTVVLMVPPEYRAFGAGNSVFMGANGPEAVRTHPRFPASVNNFAYHISLESPATGNNNGASHSGYTRPQYLSLTWLVARTGVPEDRITTHRDVDRSGQRRDPRSFNRQFLLQILRSATS
jgi:hypothetical protein